MEEKEDERKKKCGQFAKGMWEGSYPIYNF